jgi:signal transduction histidine kinase
MGPDDQYHHVFLEPIDRLLRGEMAEDFTEAELDGHWFRTKYVPLYKGPNGSKDAKHVTGIIGLSMDMTKMHATELELRERERQNRILLANENAAKEASKLKSDFLASMSHEIRTPIAGVVGMCEILLDTMLSTEQRELAEGIQRSANALLTVINDILDLSKVESGKMDIEYVQFNLSLVIRDVVKMLSFEAERKKLRFVFETRFPCKGDLIVMGDPGRVRQILANLLSNALKFTHRGSVTLVATTQKENDGTMDIHFVVEDTGIGILETDQCRLFQPFTQADSSTARKFGGTGLGLSICQKVSRPQPQPRIRALTYCVACKSNGGHDWPVVKGWSRHKGLFHDSLQENRQKSLFQPRL